MSRPSKIFLLLQFPAAALALALVAQAMSWALAGVPMRRDRGDELILAATNDPTNYRIVLLGDSVTRNATSRFALGETGEVANMATNAHFGISGEMLLLQRYLSAHRPPKYVVIVLAPSMYGSVVDLRLVRYNLWETFVKPEERSFLKIYLPDIDLRDWLPAAADMQERIVEPFFSWVKSRYLEARGRGAAVIAAGALDPDPNAPTTSSTVFPNALANAVAEGFSTVPAPLNAAALHQVCALSKQHGFRVKLAVPPQVPEIENAAITSGAAAELERNVRSVMADCQIGEITDFSRIRTYTAASFQRDMSHLYGEGWEQRYASDLRNYLKSLPD
jgi:hypothetical protein